MSPHPQQQTWLLLDIAGNYTGPEARKQSTWAAVLQRLYRCICSSRARGSMHSRSARSSTCSKSALVAAAHWVTAYAAAALRSTTDQMAPNPVLCLPNSWNRCSARGVCKLGVCLCNEGSWGIDCSLPLSNEQPGADIFVYEVRRPFELSALHSQSVSRACLL